MFLYHFCKLTKKNDMKTNVRIFILLFLPLLLATILFILPTFLSPIISKYLLPRIFSLHNLIVHLLFNFLFVALIAKECCRQSISEYDTFSPIVGFAYEMEEHGDRKTSKDDEENVYMDDKEGDDDDDGKCKYDNYYVVYSDDDEDDEYYYDGSDGYDEDDDDNGSDDEIGWSDDDDEEEEYDSDLETRIEAFIAKVLNGWKEEWLSDNLKN
ncbi:uncharacterized protein LOC125497361 [Beta vulgaris subsp. vulgaris]|uniref:uncharacterized protein LOC125497361 n=1 Tax=Beta vulgaris subsp. vulgaris TaxID=3555 RepID=UPI0020375343|nr:uncharacterized protein LOC125497361 [Beta vulgaris subsp. vulgaris]